MTSLYAAYQDTLAARHKLYDESIASGDFTPFIYPWDTLPALYLFFGIALRPKISQQYLRIFNVSIYMLILGHGVFIVTHRRTVGMASGYGIGLSIMWGFIMSTVLLLINDCSKSYARLEWRASGAPKTSSQESVHSQATVSNGNADLRQRQNGNAGKTLAPKDSSNASTEYHLVWQKLPSNPIHCIDWTLDLMTSFRGPNWNFRNPTTPPIKVPKLSSSQVEITRAIKAGENSSIAAGTNGIPSKSFYSQCIRTTIQLYFIVDIIKSVMTTDPYFLGLASIESAHPWRLVHVVHQLTALPLPFLAHTMRLLISLPGVIAVLSLIFSLCPLFFCMVLPYFIDPRVFTYAPWTEQWMYPSFFTPMFPTIANKGLAGLWGKCWHQMFRNGISEPSKPILKVLDVDPRSLAGKIIQSLIAFGLSGAIHALASYTTSSVQPSRPLMPFIFFMLQALGIFIQQAWSDLIMKKLKLSAPKAVGQVTNVLFVVIWAYYTGPILADDFARCGVWLFEPIPISFIRGLTGGSWWCWEGLFDWVGIWNGAYGNTQFWNRGIAVL